MLCIELLGKGVIGSSDDNLKEQLLSQNSRFLGAIMIESKYTKISIKNEEFRNSVSIL